MEVVQEILKQYEVWPYERACYIGKEAALWSGAERKAMAQAIAPEVGRFGFQAVYNINASVH